MAYIPNGFKKVKGAEVWVQVVIKEFIDETGTKKRLTKWQKLEEDLNLGSAIEPRNENVIAMKIVKNEGVDVNAFKNLFGGLFKGG